ncbi:MAG: Cys-tRNA(Pro) deacylase [Ruminococcus sp.]|nr:Cys-tRNA(Pro) deacylase [Ruminococcus sp.]
MPKQIKTNVMRILDRAKISYEVFEYPHGAEAVEGNEVAALMGQNPDEVFKTLVAKGRSVEYYVFDIPVNTNLNLKKAAKAVGEKSIEMVRVKDLKRICGYERGNVSPIGMKGAFKTVFNDSALGFDSIYISGGKIGTQVKLNPDDVIRYLNATTGNIV